MGRATLTLDADSSALQRAFGEIPGYAAQAQRATTAAARRGGRERLTLDQQFTREHEDISLRLARAKEKRAKEAAAKEKAEGRKSVQADADFAKLKDSIHAQLARAKEKREKEETRKIEAEQRKRVQSAAAFAKEEDRIHLQLTREKERREQRATRERRQRAREWGGRIGGALTALGSGAVEYGSAMHGQIQGARHQRAAADRDIGNAVRNAGGSTNDVQATRTRVRRFVAETGMEYGEVARALAVGQARGSSLEATEGRTPAQALDEALSIVREANAEGTDAGQYLAARGRLAAAGLRGDSLKDAMRFALRAAQSGQVEVDQLLQQGLPGASRLMSQRVAALGPQANDAQRQNAMLTAWRESVATQEVLAASGGRAGHTSNTLAGLQNFLSTTRRQEMALNNLRNATAEINTRTPEGQRRAAAMRSLYEGENSLYERDTSRSDPSAMRLKAGVSPIEFATRVAAATGSPQAAANVFAGGGVGNPQAFLSNMRDLMGVLGGERGQAIRAMMGGDGLTDARVAEHARDVEGDELSQLTRAQERGANALTDNTNEMVRLSQRFADWSAAHPFEAQGAKTGASTAGNVVGALTGGGATVAAARQVLGSTAAGRAVMGRLGIAATAGRGLLGGVMRGIFGVPTLLAAGLSAVGAYGGGPSNDERNEQNQGAAEWERQSARLSATNAAAHRPPPTAEEIGRAVAEALRAQPPTAVVSPHDAAHAASAAAPPAPR